MYALWSDLPRDTDSAEYFFFVNEYTGLYSPFSSPRSESTILAGIDFHYFVGILGNVEFSVSGELWGILQACHDSYFLSSSQEPLFNIGWQLTSGLIKQSWSAHFGAKFNLAKGYWAGCMQSIPACSPCWQGSLREGVQCVPMETTCWLFWFAALFSLCGKFYHCTFTLIVWGQGLAMFLNEHPEEIMGGNNGKEVGVIYAAWSLWRCACRCVMVIWGHFMVTEKWCIIITLTNLGLI